MEQIHANQLDAVVGETQIRVGLHFPCLSGHWSGGPPDQGGVWHDGSGGGTVTKITNAGNGTGMARCEGKKPDGSQCDDIQPVQVLR